jgi:hypothetical protein
VITAAEAELNIALKFPGGDCVSCCAFIALRAAKYPPNKSSLKGVKEKIT